MSGSDTRRAALEAAFDEAEAAEPELEIETPEVPDEPTDPEPVVEDDGTEPDVGEEAEKQKKGVAKASKDSQQVEQEAAARKGPAKSGKPASSADKGASAGTDSAAAIKPPPQSWTPAEREHWGKIPAAAQAAIQRREHETSRVLNESANSRRFQSEFVNVVKPFAHLIRARNSTPLASVQNLMQTAAMLTTGNQQQKAAIVAEILDNYGVDIKILDDVLSKRPTNPNVGNNSITPQMETALRPVYEFMNRVDQGRAQHIQAIQEDAQQTFEEAMVDPKMPFLNDLRDDVADFMEIAAARGVEMTIAQAYDKAVNFNPEIKKIVDQRARAAALNKDPKRIARARRAASSINGAPRGGSGGDGKVKTRREVIADAWDDAS